MNIIAQRKNYTNKFL